MESVLPTTRSTPASVAPLSSRPLRAFLIVAGLLLLWGANELARKSVDSSLSENEPMVLRAAFEVLGPVFFVLMGSAVGCVLYVLVIYLCRLTYKWDRGGRQ